jgi:hypothetical protein
VIIFVSAVRCCFLTNRQSFLGTHAKDTGKQCQAIAGSARVRRKHCHCTNLLHSFILCPRSKGLFQCGHLYVFETTFFQDLLYPGCIDCWPANFCTGLREKVCPALEVLALGIVVRKGLELHFRKFKISTGLCATVDLFDQRVPIFDRLR